VFLSDFGCRCVACALLASVVIFHCDFKLSFLVPMTNSFSIAMWS
jgi:hypothetical protein